MLVLEDGGGGTLDTFISGPMEVTQFLGFAVGLASALDGLHERKLIHKDVKPANVLVNSATGQILLMGFGIASRLRREHQVPEPPSSSPEHFRSWLRNKPGERIDRSTREVTFTLSASRFTRC